MLEYCAGLAGKRVLDLGCGEGRFVRKLSALGAHVVGLDPTRGLLAHARTMSPAVPFVLGDAERLPFVDACFDAVIAYLVLIDIPDFRAAIHEVARVLRPSGLLIVANLNGFASSSKDGWVKDEQGERLYFPVVDYLEERAEVVAWRGICIENFHRPLSAYMKAFLASGLVLEDFQEPRAPAEAPKAEFYNQVPWHLTMRWRKP